LPRKHRRKANIDGAGPSSWTGSDANQAANLNEIQRARNEGARCRMQIKRKNENQAKRKKRLDDNALRSAKRRTTEKSSTKVCVKRDGMFAITLIHVSGS
jgi:hypothetical protein